MKSASVLMPTFIGIGEMKCGTTWMSECLRYHPEIFMTIPKEIHFFGNESNWNKGIEWYSQYFKGSSKYNVRGEFSTSYLQNSSCVERIRKINDKVKIIVLLRDPVERFISHYKQLIRQGSLAKSGYNILNMQALFEVQKTFPHLINRGRYYSNLKPYIETFGNENIDIVIKNDIDENHLAEIKKVYNFLGVNPNFIPSIIDKAVSPGIIPRFQILESLRMRLGMKLNKELPRLVGCIRRLRLAEVYRKFNADKRPDRFKIDEKVVEELSFYYHDEISKLERFLNRDLRMWKRETLLISDIPHSHIRRVTQLSSHPTLSLSGDEDRPSAVSLY